MTSEVTEGRLRRRAAQQIFDQLALDYLDLPGVNRAMMFGSDGLRVNAKFFAFVGRDGQLIIKLPAAHAENLLAAGQASPVRAARGTMREWIGIPCPDDHGGTGQWQNLTSCAYRYVASLTPTTHNRPNR